ncbi:hypothetical protein LUZ62_026214 [Rhynchospora pubera]|uniref:DUF3444 domain-containing protein n=1 Tax=Rhynchospora pubera TaxID=906938 RepID=A0AAV8HFT7_9POAL|nr:hypothetical protein LUZ62_026214 [Rhynchospora pubera]
MECDEYECPDEYEFPEHEFYNFEKNKSIKLGQIWALYSDMDTFPKYYAQVKRINLKEQIVYIQWLEPIGKGAVGEDKRWIDSMLPSGCGTFVVTGEKNSYDKYAFSHKVTARQLTGKKNAFEIIPVVTEIWAVYRDWTLILSGDDIDENCQYDLVWVSELTHTGIKVLLLAIVAGHRTVFRLDSERKSVEIPRGEFTRLSHIQNTSTPAHS